jgi:dTDP-L-rhamnose 4-epimerase
VLSLILITGGAGFIGSHLTQALRRQGHRVRVLDALVEQVHGPAPRVSLDEGVELVVGDVRDPDVVRGAVTGVDAVVHLAARVGVGQSMYEIVEYVDCNSRGTAVLLEALLDSPVRKLVVASSMSIYGEGLYAPTQPRERTLPDLEQQRWDPVAETGEPVHPLPTPESKPPANSSIYALSKYDQERMCLLFGQAYQIPVVALRFFNVYGPGQALSNPYTGVLAIFASRLLNSRPPLVFEDGEQRRDFVSVNDVVQACLLALEHDGADGHAVNIGSGRSVTVTEVGRALARVLGKEIEPACVGKFRVGDIRHCFADISLATKLLGYRPSVALEQGMIELAAWLGTQSAAPDRVEAATAELVSRGLAR